MFDFTLKLFLLLSPLVYQRWFPTNEFAIWFFRFGVMALFGIAITQRARRHTSNKWMGVFLGLVLVNTFLNSFAFRLFNPEKMSVAYLDSFFTLFLAFVLYYLIITYAKDIKGCLYWMAGACIINVFLVSLQMAGIELIFNRFSSQPTGTMGLSSSCGLLMAMGVFLGMRVHWLLFTPFFMTTLFIRSDSAVFALLVGLMFYSIRSKNWTRILIITLIMLLILVAWCVGRWDHLKYSIGELRFLVWEKTLQAGLMKPLRGHGVGSFVHENIYLMKGTKLENNVWPSAKNEGAQLLYMLGVLGPISAGLIAGNMANRFRRTEWNTTLFLITTLLVMVVVNSLFQCPFRDPRFVAWIVFLLAAFHILTIKQGGCDVA